MAYHDLSSCTLTDAERFEEKEEICELILGYLGTDSLNQTEKDFVSKISTAGFLSVKQLFWLRDIKDKCL